MISDLLHNDQPIDDPSNDAFGIDPFSSALAESIRKLRAPNGSVIALNGPWGSGKSSALNLVLHHLEADIENKDVVVINFACWWFRGEEALALAFFRELYAGMSPSLSKKVKKALPKLAKRLLSAGSIVGEVVDVAGGNGAGTVFSKVASWLSGLFKDNESVERLHGALSKELAAQNRKFLVVIDDIDRLSPDEALLIFRLVKSVGQLPNVIYLLAYDRILAEKIVADRFPSEGPHYLEKIVQAAFELPDPLSSDLQNHFLAQIEKICGVVTEDKGVSFMNLFYEAVAPELKTPRDGTRFLNSLAIAWPAVAGNVDMGDFLALEALRLRRPEVYRSVRRSKEILCNGAMQHGRRSEDLARDLDKQFLGSVREEDRSRYRRSLMRLFPRLESVWGNTTFGSDFERTWARDRRVCSHAHFDSYFRFAVSADVVSVERLEELVANARNKDFVKAELRSALNVARAAGGTQVATLLDELRIHAEKIENKDVWPLLSAIFEIADELDVEGDKGRGFSIGGNDLRIHWLLRELTRDRFSLQERSSGFIAACETASLGWLADFTSSAWGDYHPDEGKPPEPEDRCLTTLEDARHLRQILHQRLLQAAATGVLLNSKDLAYLLYRWVELEDNESIAVKAWTDAQLETDESTNKLIVAFTSYGWSQSTGFDGLGDLVAKRSIRAQVSGIDKILNKERFRERVEQLATSGNYKEADAFLTAWKKQSKGDEWF
jgi:predicted KAP-like P-loop ATPase